MRDDALCQCGHDRSLHGRSSGCREEGCECVRFRLSRRVAPKESDEADALRTMRAILRSGNADNRCRLCRHRSADHDRSGTGSCRAKVPEATLQKCWCQSFRPNKVAKG